MTLTTSATAVAKQPAGSSRAVSAPAASEKIVLGSGETVDGNHQDTNTSFCEFPPGATAVNLDPGEGNCAPGSPVHPFVEPNIGPWGAPIPPTQWVGPDPSGNGGDLNHTTKCPVGKGPTGKQSCDFYVYNATFQLDNPCGGKVSFVGKLMADNLAGVFLNGTFIAQQPVQAGFTYNGQNPPAANTLNPPFPFSASGPFISGTNVIDFVVFNSTHTRTGLDYSVTVTVPAPKPCGTLKICKVAGFGIALGTPFTFKTTGGVTATTTVPAGPAPGGWCQIVGQAVGTVNVQEVIPTGDQVTSITSTAGGTPNLAAGTISTTVAANKVTEVTYTNQNRKVKTGFLEICKSAQPVGGVAPPSTFTFTVNGSPVTVPTNACTSPIQVAAGTANVVETPAGGYTMAACSTIPAANLLSCNPGANTATVKVLAGAVPTETILNVTNSNPAGG